jgi:hypothetical protein
MEIKKLSPMLMEIRIPYGEPAFFFLSSDWHYDNPKCLRDKLHKHLDITKEKQGHALCFGDFFCFMQGKYDPRSSKKDIRPEHKVSNYIDAVIDDTVELLKDYPILMVSNGNHERNLLTRLETDVVQRYVDKHNLISDYKTYVGGYHGFIKFVFHNNNSNTKTYLMYFHHGLWGGSVMKGFQANTRYASYVDADFIVSGHIHTRHLDESMRYNITKTGNLELRPQYFIKSGTYKEEYLTDNGWAIEKLAIPKNIGGWFLEFTGKHRDTIDFKISMT